MAGKVPELWSRNSDNGKPAEIEFGDMHRIRMWSTGALVLDSVSLVNAWATAAQAS